MCSTDCSAQGYLQNNAGVIMHSLRSFASETVSCRDLLQPAVLSDDQPSAMCPFFSQAPPAAGPVAQGQQADRQADQEMHESHQKTQ